MNDVIRNTKEALVKALKAARPGQLALINEYIGEAEHQEGDAYWLEFESPAELIEDFDLYAANV